MAPAAKKATEAPERPEEPQVDETEAPEAPAEETIEKPVAVRQPQYLADKHGRLHPDAVAKAREDAGIAPQYRLVEHTAAGVLKGS